MKVGKERGEKLASFNGRRQVSDGHMLNANFERGYTVMLTLENVK